MISKTFKIKAFLGILIFFSFAYFNLKPAEASVFQSIKNIFINKNNEISTSSTEQLTQSEDAAVLKYSAKNIQNEQSSSTVLTINKDVNSNEEFLVSSVGAVRAQNQEELVEQETIIVYEVKEGDTVTTVANLFDVTPNTIRWANDITGSKLKKGDTLIILPIDGVKHVVKKGDTLKSLAKKYKGDVDEIAEFNNLKVDGELVIGETVVIPDGEIYVDPPKPKVTVAKKTATKKILKTESQGYYVRPVAGCVKTQGIHGNNAVDIGCPVGTSIVASADGVVQVARPSGYNGGYGQMVIISHSNGSQTVYAHMSGVYVSQGQSVKQGEVIGATGNTGKSTGPHIHFEIRGATNPF